MIKLLASTFILKPLTNHVKYGNTFALIYIDFHTLWLGDFGVFGVFFGVSFIVKNGLWKSCYYGFYLKLFFICPLVHMTVPTIDASRSKSSFFLSLDNNCSATSWQHLQSSRQSLPALLVSHWFTSLAAFHTGCSGCESQESAHQRPEHKVPNTELKQCQTIHPFQLSWLWLSFCWSAV